MSAALLTRTVDTRHRPGVGTIQRRYNPLTGRSYTVIALADVDRPVWLLVPDGLVPGLDGCWTPDEVRALLGGTP